MNPASPSQVKAWCIGNGFHPNRTLGQNFLVDRNILEAIASAGLEGVSPGALVLEVGPGLGALTGSLLERGVRVVAVEKDPVLAERLDAALGSPDALRTVRGDALRYISDGMEGLAFDAMVSNLPYQCGTRILLELALARAIPRMTALVQTEVAERLASPEGSKTRSLAGVLAQLDYDVRILRKVSATCFWPRPEVGSAVVSFVRHDGPEPLDAAGRRAFRDAAKRAFAHRRKQLGGIFRADLVKSTARAEDLSNAQWIELAKGLANGHT